MSNFISGSQIEQVILQKLRQFNFEMLNCYTANPDDLNDHSNRSDKRDVILKRVAPKLQFSGKWGVGLKGK